jgi:hypothetical protein
MVSVIKFFAIAGFFAVMVLAGAFCSWSSWHGVIYVYVGEARMPAAVQRKLDLSNLKGADLRIASRNRLLSEGRLLKDKNLIGIQLGHFITASGEGVKQFACQSYQRVRLVFQAEGVANDGEVPQMTLEGPCLMSEDVNYISPFWIPQAKLLMQRPHDFEIEYEENDMRTTFNFSRMGSEWPSAWSLESALLYDPDHPETALEFSPQEVRALHPKQLTLHWDADRLAPLPLGPSGK